MIGILPAAGSATRICGLPKMLLPIRDTYLLKKHVQEMQSAAVYPVYVGVNKDNCELVRQYAGHGWVQVAERHSTMTETVQSVGQHYNNAVQSVLFGMPDTYWTAYGVYSRLAIALESADVAVAVWSARPGQHKKGGMCWVGESGKVIEVVDKPSDSDYEWIWGALAWKPAFWQYMQPNDPHVGYALPRAIAAGLDVRAVQCEGGYYDCGTIGGYYEALTAAMKKETA